MAVRVAIAVAIFAALVLPVYSLIQLDKDTFVLGEDVNVEFTPSPGLRLDISKDDSVFSYLGNESHFAFTPSSSGFYEIRLINITHDSVRESKGFAVVSSQTLNVFTDKKSYLLGEPVFIYADLGFQNQSYNMTISTDKEIFFFLGEIKNPLQFIPRSVGNYEVRLFGSSGITSSNFSVESYDPFRAKRSSFRITSPKKSYYIGDAVELKLTFPQNETLEFYIKSGENVYRFFGIPQDSLTFIPKEAGEYEASIEQAGNLLASYKFNITQKPAINQDELSKFLNYSFNMTDDAQFEIDFAQKTGVVRNIIEASLRTTLMEQATAYIEGHHNDENFELSIEHVEYDRFKITVKSNPKIQPGVYKLIAAGKYSKKTYRIDILFNWGISDQIAFDEQTAKQKKTKQKPIETQKQSYSKEDAVFVDSNISLIDIIYNNFTFRFTSDMPYFAYVPPAIGDYEIKAQESSDAANFHVLAAQNLPVQQKAETGKKVRWKKTVKVRNEEAPWALVQSIIPSIAQNISVSSQGEQIEPQATGFYNDSLLYFFNDLMPFEEKEYTIEYETPAPSKDEVETKNSKVHEKDITIAQPQIPYENVESYTNIEEAKIGQVKVMWLVNGTEVDIAKDPMFNVTFSDTNSNGMFDRVSWTTSIQSEQKFKVKVVKSVDIDLSLKDSSGSAIEADFETYTDDVLSGTDSDSLSRSFNLSKRNDIAIYPKNKAVRKVEVYDVISLSDSVLTMGIDDVPASKDKSRGWNRIYAIDPGINFSNATLHARASGKELYKCKDWSFENQTCMGTWQFVMNLVPGEDYTVSITPDDPGFGETNITIINVQSYPTVGGEWIVRFNTTGTADLYITASNGTRWSNSNNFHDLRFMEVRCGNVILPYQWIDNGPGNSSVFIPGYSCDETATEKSMVLTTGKHVIKFQFGDSVSYANNFASFFVDNTDEDFNGTRFRVNVTGSGVLANVTLNHTINNTFKKYFQSGNYTSRIFDTGNNISRFEAISWFAALPNTSDVVGFAMDGPADEIAVFYRNSTHGIDLSQTNLASNVIFAGTQKYNLPTRFNTSDILGFAVDNDGSDTLFVFFRNGSVANTADLGASSFNQVITFTTIGAWTIPAGFNRSNVIGFSIDTDINGADGAAVFFKNGSFVTAPSEASPFAFAVVRAFTLPAGFSTEDTIGVDYDNTAEDSAMFFRNGSFVVDNSQSLATNIAFTDVLSATFNSGQNISVRTNITFNTRVSNDSNSWTPWSSTYIDPDSAITSGIGRYIQYKAVFSTFDPYVAPILENVTINYTIDTTPPLISNMSPANNSFSRNPINLSFNTDENANCKYNESESFNFTAQGTIFNVTGSLVHSKSFGNLPDGRYLFYLKCNDTVGNTHNNSDQIITIFNVDNGPPNVSILSPANNANLTNKFVNLTWNASDAMDSSLLCNVTLDGSVIASDMVSPNNTITHYVHEAAEGRHFWNVTCLDDAGNQNTSLTNFFVYALRKSVASIQTINASYKQDQNVNLFSSIRDNREDQESSVQQAIARLKDYGILFEDFDSSGWTTISGANPTAGCSGGFGLFSNCSDNAGDYLFGKTSGGVHISDGYMLDLQDWDTLNDDDGIFHVFNPQTICSGECRDIFVGGYVAGSSFDNANEFCIVWALNNTETVRRTIATCIDGETACEFTDTANALTNNVSNFKYFNATLRRNISLDISRTSYLEVHIGADESGSGDDCFYEDINITGLGWERESNSTAVTYSSIGGSSYLKISDIDITVETRLYNSSASRNLSNFMPDIEVALYNGTDYSYKYVCNLTNFYGNGSKLPYNCTNKIKDKITLDAWASSSNRRMQVKGIYLDSTPYLNDTINWSGVYVEIETPSKIENYGNTSNITATLLMQVLNKSLGVMFTAYSQVQSIRYNSTLNLTSLWSTWNTESYPLGNYTARVSLLDSQGSVLVNSDGTYINDSYIFTIDYLKLFFLSPLNNTDQEATGFWANISQSYISFPSGGYCEYEIDPFLKPAAINSTPFSNFTESGGSYVNLTAVDSSTWYIGNENTDALPYQVNATQEIVFRNNDLIRTENLRNLTLNVTYCHTAKSAGNIRCTGTAATGTLEVDQNVSIFNYSGSKWTSLGRLRTTSGGSLITDVFYSNGTLSDFVNSTSMEVKYRIRSHFTNTLLGDSAFLVLDRAYLQTKSRTSMLNDTAINFFNFTKPIPEGWHNITAFCNDTSGDMSHTEVSFNATDRIHPIVNLSLPPNFGEEPNGNITFAFNVSDLVSGIANCTLEFMFADNQTNYSITENQNQSFRIYNLDNGGPYSWRIRCTDNSSQKNEGNSSYFDFLVGQDTDFPIITLRDPIDNYNTSNNDVTFSYRVNDLTSSILNCTLILNNTINRTNSTITEQGAFPFVFNNFTVFDMPDRHYNWSVNCTDSSNNKNTAASATRLLRVQRDTDSPVIVLLGPANNSIDTDGLVSFQYNVTDFSSNIANCSLFVNNTINTTVQSPAENTVNTITPTAFNQGVYFWNISCTDDSFDLNRNSSEFFAFNVSILSSLRLGVGKSKQNYEQGTQLNETALVYVNTTDAFNAKINATIATDIISGNTTARWWNSSWKRRIPLFLNESRNENRTNDVVVVNITGLGGYIQNCKNEIRIIYNRSYSSAEIPLNVIDGDDSTWCYVKFKANATQNLSRQNDYHAYYNFTGAQNPAYPRINDVYNVTLMFENFDGTGWDVIATEDPDTGCAGGFGSNFNRCDDNSDDYDFATTTGATAEISTPNILVFEDIDNWFANSSIYFQTDPRSACDGKQCEDIRVTGYMASASIDASEYCRVWARVVNTTAFTTITECTGGACEFTGSDNTLPATAADYQFFNASLFANFSLNLRDSNYTAIHIGGLLPANDDHCFYDNIKVEGLRNESYNLSVYTGAHQELVNSSSNDTGNDGSTNFSQGTSGLATGWYSAISFAFATGYANSMNFTFFQVINDSSAPTVSLAAPSAGFISDVNYIDFFYNATDLLSGIRNCSLVINNTINMSNASVAEDARLNFSVLDFNNGVYLWTVNCTDDSVNRNRGTDTSRLFSIAVDSTPPRVILTNPQNNYTDTNLNVSFNYTVSDDFTSTADCVLYINGTANTTHENVQTDGSTRTFDNLTFFNNGSFNWYVNCTDDSIARNNNVSLSRNFTTAEDLEAPVIVLVSPPNPAHLTNPNVTFVYNVTDLISNVSFCSLSINGTLNQTNFTIREGVLQNFTLNNISGNFNWSINCTDSSENKNKAESEVYDLLVAPDIFPPVIDLDFPPHNIELNPGNISFIFNVTDLASDIRNCTLHINNTINRTLLNVLEGVPQNMTQNLTDGFYTWHINCTDNSANLNHNRSEKRNLTIGTDRTAPIISLYEPLSGYSDTNGIIFFNYTANDIASQISNCSIIINNTINLTNSTIEKLATENFTISGFNNGTFSWQVNCTDNSSSPNIGNSSSRLFSVILDVENPIVRLADPPNGTIDTNGRRTFFYNTTDTISSITNCSLIINNVLNQTNTTVIEDTRSNFTVSGLADGDYNFSVNCTDNSENFNTGSSAFRYITVINDNAAPSVTLIGPLDNATDSNGIATFNYSVSDTISGISGCTLTVGSNTYQDTTISEGVLQQFNVTGLTTADYYWNVTCTDDSENSNSAVSSSRNISVLIDNSAPVVSLIRPLNNTQELFNNVTFFYNVTDISEIGNCSLIINGTINQSNTTRITKAATLNFTIVDAPNGTISWEVNCSDVTEDKFVGSSEERIVIIGPDITAPIVLLSSPPADIQDTDGNFTFEYNATDLTSGLANCSLYINSTLNQTTYKPQKDAKLNFTLNETPIGVYTWQVQCYDNFTNPNLGVSEIRAVSVGEDTTGPSIALLSPANNSVLNGFDALLEYNAVDFASNISNCTLILNGLANITNYTISELSSNFFNLYMLDDADYSWQVNCTDGSNNSNRAASAFRNFTLFRPKQLIADIYTNQSSYEQGSTVLVTVNITNSSLEPFDSPVYIDIIRGNTTAPFFDSLWAYRIPIDINTTNVTRKDPLVELSINFTRALVSEMGISGKTFDGNSIRVVEWMNNRSVLIPYQFENSPNFNTTTEASGKISWILNGTTSNSTIRQFFVYFDTTDNGAKPPPNFSSSFASYSFSGSEKTVLYDGSPQSADFVRISKGTESVSLQFANGQDISNQQNIDWQGAGALWNITADSTRLSNLYDSIVPVALYNNYFLHLNSTANITTGPVYTKVRIPGRLNASLETQADLNYTIWFGQNDIIVRADLSVVFTSANNDPQSLFNNLWFAYLFDYDSDYNSFIRNMNSSSFVQTHRWHLPIVDTDTTNQFNSGDWYSEYAASRGSVNVFLKKFELSGSPSTNGLISYDDWYNPGQSKTTESDGVGFNLNSDQTISGGDSYSITAYMVLSANKTSLRAAELKSQVDWPMNITVKKAQKLVNRTQDASGSDGIYSFGWSTANQAFGNYTATVIANKSLYILGVDFWDFSIAQDTTSPVVGLVTANDTWFNSVNITLTYNVSDANSISNCTLFVKSRPNLTEYSITNNANNIFRVNNTAEGFYYWMANCTDSAGNYDNSTTRNFTVDITKPIVNLTGPANNTLFNITSFEFNFTVRDNLDQTLACDFVVDDLISASVNATNGTLTRKNLTLTQAVHLWYVNCSDSAGNINSSDIRIVTVDSGAPTITLNSPANNSFSANQNISLYYTPFDLSLANCSLIINGQRNQTNFSPLSITQNKFMLENRTENKMEWQVNCTDNIGQQGSSDIFSIFFDYTAPSTSLSNPSSGFIFNSSSVQLNFTTLDNFDNFLDCNVTINGTVNNSQLLGVANNSVFVYNSSGFTDGYFYWSASCIDSANNSAASATRNFSVKEAPSIALISPANATRNRKISQNFTYIPRDNSGKIANCTLILNNQANVTNSSINSSILNNLTVNNLAHSAYNWSVNCTDTSANTGTNLTPYLLYVDLVGPSITLNKPIQGEAFNTDDISFNFTPTDQFGISVNLNCSITLDGSVNVSNIIVPSASDNLTLIENLSQGPHTYNVTCFDDLNNSNSSATLTFIVNSPDLTINVSDTYFNNTNPDENNSVLINATIYNIGGISAENFTVLFYDRNILFENDSILILPFGTTMGVNATFNATRGFHNITIIIDYGRVELSKLNNNITNNLTLLLPEINSPANNTWTNSQNTTINFTLYDFANSTLNYTIYLDDLFNRSANITDNTSIEAQLNLSEGVHRIIIGANGPRVDFHGKNSSLFRKKNSTALYVNVDRTSPVSTFETANQSWFSDNTPEIRFNITDLLDSVLNYTLYINKAANQTNYTSNAISRAVNLSVLDDGTYNLTIEAYDEAGNRANSSSLTIYIDTASPVPRILTINSSNFSDATPEILFNITDAMAPTINYSFYVDFSIDKNGTAQNGINKADNLTSLADGYRVVILQATDLAGNKANSSFINITIDTTPPVITVENPSEAEATGYTISLLASVTDALVGTSHVRYSILNDSGSVFQNGTLNASTSFDDLWDSALNVTESFDFMYINFSITANDTLGNSRNFIRRFLVDNKRPSIEFVYPSGHDVNRDFNLDVRVVNRNITRSTYNITNMTGDLLLNNSNASIFVNTHNWTHLVNISNSSFFLEGFYNLSVFAIDDVGNNRTSYSLFRIDRTFPNVTLRYPPNNSNFSTTLIGFNFSAVDNFDSHLNCNLTIDGVVTVLNINATNNTVANTTVNLASEGTHFWTVSCEDNAGNLNVSVNRTFTVDQGAPRIQLERPSNNSFNSSTSMEFFYTVNDTTGVNSCTLILNGLANQTNTTIQNGIQNNFTVTTLEQNRYQWTVNCTDIVGNVGTNDSLRFLYIDTTAPNASFITNNGTWFSDATPEIFFNITDNFDSFLNFTIYVDGSSNVISWTANGTSSSRNLTSLPNGTHIVAIESYDDAYNRINSTNLTIIIDTVFANITLLGPLNNSNLSASDITFFFNASDNLDEELLCNLSINNAVNISYFPANSTRNTSRAISGFDTGFYNWSVSCMDNATNTVSSPPFYFNLTPPDLEVSQADITFNVTDIEEGKNITIFVNVTNMGKGDARNAVVQIFEGDPDANGIQINGNFSLNLTFDQNKTINVSWSFGIGASPIFVQVDRAGRIQELNETNNKANRSANVSAYNIIFGNITGSLILGSLNNRTVFSWEVSNSSAGSIFTIDSDSNIAWTNLSALSVNISYGNTTTDFADLDRALNMTNLTDSINRTYTFGSRPKDVQPYIVFAAAINNTPIANSTNNSNFVTGILWDKSDANTGEYNGSQDVVFISSINRMVLSKYGLYDFEIRVPARLRQYRQPNLDNSVTFYVELK